MIKIKEWIPVLLCKLWQRNFLFLYISLLTFLLASELKAQSGQAGIYQTGHDYMNGQLTDAFFCDSTNGKIRAHLLFRQHYIVVSIEGHEHIYRKDSIYGYRDCDSNIFRLYHADRNEYQLLETHVIVMYLRYVPIKSSTGRTVDMVPAYFFSKTPDSEIWPLNVLNLKRTFPEQQTFHGLLDMVFGDGLVLSVYDYEHGMFLVNYLLTLKQE